MSDTFLPGSGFDTYEEQDKVLVGLCGGRGCAAAWPSASCSSRALPWRAQWSA